MRKPTTDQLFHVKQYLCSFDDDEPSSNAVSTVSNDPWGPQGDRLKEGFSRAEDLFNTPLEYYPGSTVVPWAPETEQAMTGLTDLAQGGMPSIDAARDEALATIRGDYLNRENPHYQQLADTVSGDVLQRVGSRMGSSVGAFGSPAHAQSAARGVTQGLAPLQYDTFRQERGNQLSLLPQAAGIEMMGATPSNILGQVGAAREGQAGAELGADINRFNFEQQEPRRRLQEYMASVAGGRYGGTQTSSNPVYSNPWATGLGAASSIAGIGGSLFGGGGVFPGALSGMFG